MKVKKIVATLTAAIFMTSLVVGLPSNSMIAQAASTAYLDSQGYTGNDLGANYSPSKTTFKVWAPSASKVQVKLYKTGSDSETGAGVIGTYSMNKGNNGVWSITRNEDLKNVYYTYLVTVDGNTKETVDIYAKAAGVNGDRGMVVDLDSTDPVGWNNDQHVTVENQTDAVVWECHIRDFSIASNSGISSKHKGKYLAFTEEGTTLNNDGVHSTGIDYLKKLGITHIQLLPSYDYGSVDESKLNQDQFNWGYDPKNYNIPEGSYSTDPYNGEVRIKEYKQMVQSLHNNGIGVVMDVVYNHTYSKDDSWFERTVPGYYFRYASNGKLSDGSGCGNETRSESTMYRKYMIDSILYWANEYHIDGFRFDLMGIHDVETMNEIRKAVNKINPDIMIYGEPWSGGTVSCAQDTCYQYNMKKVNNEIGAFNDKIRDAIKGSTYGGAGKGFVQGVSGKEGSLKNAIQANSTSMAGTDKWANQPSQVVSYVSAHDNLALYDHLVKTTKGDYGYNQRFDDVVQMNKLAAGIYLTSQGMSFMQAGEEFARTKNGDDNSYKSSTSINQLDWQRTVNYSDVVDWYKGLIEIRKAYSPFRDPSMTSNNTIYFSWGNNCPANVVAYTMYNKITSDSEWNYVGVIHNANSSSKTVTLQNSGTLPTQWVVVADGNKAGTEKIREISGTSVEVPARSTMILVDKASYDAHPVNKKKGTVTIKYVDKDTNKELATSKSITGVVGEKYNTSAIDIDGYELSSTPSNASGAYIEGNITVIYKYKKDNTPRGTVTIKYVNKANRAEIAPSTSISGKKGTSYTTSPLDIKGYEVDRTSMPSNASGKYTSGNIVVTYYYLEKEVESLKVHYYNANNWSDVYMYSYSKENKNTIQHTGKWPGTKMKSEGNGWYEYEVEDITEAYVIFNNGGSSQEPYANEDGYLAEDEVWIKDKKVSKRENGKVIVKYVEQSSGDEIASSVTLSGKVGEKYTTIAKDINGYELVKTPSNATGSYTKNNIEVVYEYKKSEVQKGKVTVQYVDASTGEELVDPVTITGKIGNKYTARAIRILGYKLTKNPSNYTGKFTKSNITVTYKYTKGTSMPLAVTSYSATPASGQKVGSNVSMKMQATGTGEISYKFMVKDSDGNITIVQNYSNKKVATWKPTKAGKYTLYFTAVDSTGRLVFKLIGNYVINK